MSRRMESRVRVEAKCLEWRWERNGRSHGEARFRFSMQETGPGTVESQHEGGDDGVSNFAFCCVLRGTVLRKGMSG